MGRTDALTDEILSLLPQIMRVVRPQIHAGSKLNLTVPQFRILAQIGSGCGHVGQLAEYHGVAQPSMSRIVEGLVKRGYVRRVPDRSDRRCIELRLTTKGESLYQSVKKRVERSVQTRLAKLSRTEQNQIQAALTRLSRVFDSDV